MTIQEIQDKIIEDFNQFEEWLDKYDYLIELASELPLIDEQDKTDKYKISGCQSNVWLKAELKDGKMILKADSDAIITKGIIALLLSVCNNQNPKEVLENDLYFIDAIGLKENLSPTRSNGLVSMIQQIKYYALAFSQQQK
jgi:cysteine desulfuration protein SufE